MDNVPYIVFESEMARLERVIKRLWALLLIAVLLLVATNIAWLRYEMQYENETTTVEQEVETGDGSAVATGIGDIVYGENKTESDSQETH